MNRQVMIDLIREVKNQSTEFRELKRGIHFLQSDMQNVKTNVEHLQKNCSNLKEDRIQKETELEGLKSDNAKIYNQMMEISTNITSIQQESNKLRDFIQNLQKEVAKLTKIAMENKELEAQKGSIQDISERMERIIDRQKRYDRTLQSISLRLLEQEEDVKEIKIKDNTSLHEDMKKEDFRENIMI